MTYDKLGTGESPFTGTCFNECVYTKVAIAVLVRSALGWQVSPTQRRNTGKMPLTGGGRLLRLQSTYLPFDTYGKQLPFVRFEGTCHHPYVENVTEGRSVLVRVEMIADDELVIDMGAKTVKLNGEMVWGYSGRWFEVDSGDVVRAGAEGIGAGFAAFVGVETVEGLITRREAGAGALSASALGRPQIDVARVGSAAAGMTGTGHRQGVGRAYSERRASGTKTVQH